MTARFSCFFVVVESLIDYVSFNAEAHVTALLGSQDCHILQGIHGALSPCMWEGFIIVRKEFRF